MWLRKTQLSTLEAAASAVSSGSAERKLQRRHTPLLEEVKPLDENDFRSGFFLQKFTNRCVQIGIREVGRPAWTEHLVHASVTSLCTGSAMDHVCLKCVGQSLQGEKVPIALSVVTTCEMVADKVDWIHKIRKCLDYAPVKCCNFIALQEYL